MISSRGRGAAIILLCGISVVGGLVLREQWVSRSRSAPIEVEPSGAPGNSAKPSLNVGRTAAPASKVSTAHVYNRVGDARLTLDKSWQPRVLQVAAICSIAFGTTATFSPDGKTLAVPVTRYPNAENRYLGGDAIQLWDVPSKSVRRVLALAPAGGEASFPPGSVAPVFSPDNSVIAMEAETPAGGEVSCWNIRSGKRLHRVAGYDPRFTNSGRQVMAHVSGGQEGDYVFWDVASGLRRRVMHIRPPRARMYYSDVDYPGGKTGPAWIFSPAKGIGAVGLLQRTKTPPFLPRDSGGIMLFSLATGRPTRLLPPTHQRSRFDEFAFDSAGRYLAVVSGVPDGEENSPNIPAAEVWDLNAPNRRKPIFSVSFPMETSPKPLLAPDGSTLVIQDLHAEHIELWNIHRRRRILRAECEVYSRAFSPDSRIFAVGNGTEVRLYDTRNGRKLLTLRNASGAQYLDFSPDGGTLAVVGSNAVGLWRLK